MEKLHRFFKTLALGTTPQGGGKGSGLSEFGEYGPHGELGDHVALLGVQGPGDRDSKQGDGREEAGRGEEGTERKFRTLIWGLCFPSL